MTLELQAQENLSSEVLSKTRDQCPRRGGQDCDSQSSRRLGYSSRFASLAALEPVTSTRHFSHSTRNMTTVRDDQISISSDLKTIYNCDD